MNRTPPTDVLQTLRREIGFGCPVPCGDHPCGCPYLSWHHFDPPWKEREHHDPEGMIALCREHHDKADAGAFTKEQLRSYKRTAQAKRVSGSFDWRRRKVLLVAGGTMFCYGSRRPLSIGGFPIIWETRDEDGYMLLNVTMLSRTPQPRLQLRDNCWTLYGDPEHFICPPHGRLIDVKYRNGDLLRVEFVSDDSEESLLERYPHLPFVKDFNFPLVTVDIRTEIAGSGISISEKGVKTPGMTLGGMSLYTDPHHGISIG